MEINTIRINNPFNYIENFKETTKDLFRNANYKRATNYYLNNDLIMLKIYLESCISTYDFQYNIDVVNIKNKVINNYIDEIEFNEKLLSEVTKHLLH